MVKARFMLPSAIMAAVSFFFVSLLGGTAALASSNLEWLQKDVSRGAPRPRTFAIRPVFQELVSKRSLLIIMVGGAATGWAWDDEDPSLMRRFLDRPTFDVGCDYGDVYGSGIVQGAGILGLLATGYLSDQSYLADAGKDLSYSLLTSGAVVWALKIGTNRRRPNGGKYSFPSGHTAVAFSTVPVLSHYFGWKAGIMACTLAGFTALGRMEENRHYLSDVLFGASIGLAAGYATVSRKEPPGALDFLSLGPDQVGIRVRF